MGCPLLAVISRAIATGTLEVLFYRRKGIKQGGVNSGRGFCVEVGLCF